MKATRPDGILKDLPNCYIKIFFNRDTSNISYEETIQMNNLPDISSSKSANYPEESPIGRSTPFKSFRNSETRSISWTAHFFVQRESDIKKNLKALRAIEAALYTQESTATSYAPPPICKLKCGYLLSKDEICAVLKSYSFKADPSYPWDEKYYLPYKFDIDMQFDVVYDNKNLPNANKILNDLD